MGELAKRLIALEKKNKALEAEILKLKSTIRANFARFDKFMVAAMELKPEGFSDQDYLGFTVDQLRELVKSRNAFDCVESGVQCEECTKSTRMACWETLNQPEEKAVEADNEGVVDPDESY